MSCCEGDGSVIEKTVAPHTHGVKKGETLTMTPQAADFVKELLKKDKKESWGLKIEVIPGGCAGFKYFMELQEKPDKSEKEFAFHGVRVFLSLMSIGFIKGSTIEFVQSLEATGLNVNNPNATRGCACGKSFG